MILQPLAPVSHPSDSQVASSGGAARSACALIVVTANVAGTASAIARHTFAILVMGISPQLVRIEMLRSAQFVIHSHLIPATTRG
jgi:hypothetical protein